VRILVGIANQTAVAIENARLQAQEAERVRLSRELELAHDIQQNLLPQETPVLSGYQVVYRWRSAREVGGDFFDFVPLDDHRLGIVLADVSDKGVPAALYMMFARTLMRAAAFSGREPAEALARTNEVMLADSRSEMFVTAYYSTLDAEKHLLTYASAGHNLAMHVPANGGAPVSLITEGIPLGILSRFPTEQKTLTLFPGDVVLFYTDGVTEAVNTQDEQFGDERLAEILCEHRTDPADAIADAIEAAVRKFTGDGMLFDDFTLVLVKRDH
jgi:sigma-B regulation protein RsbU (phosphoserine phosphatase)